MAQDTDVRHIPYMEYRAIVNLMHAHLDRYQDNLRAIVAFGDLVTSGDTFDIDLLEVIQGWTGKRYAVSSGSIELPLRGQLRLYLLTPDEFENPETIRDANDREWTIDLLERVRRGFEVILEV